MVNEVNKLIYNTLLDYNAVTLPDVGSLRIVVQPAALNGNRVAAPKRDITFSSKLDAVSVVSRIAEECNISLVQAEDVYNRWLNKVRAGNIINIQGVGIINIKSFKADADIICALNFDRTEEIKVGYRANSRVWMWFAVPILLAAVAGVVVYTCKDVDFSQSDTKINTIKVNTLISSTEVAKIDSINTDYIEQIQDAETTISNPDFANSNDNDLQESTCWTENNNIRHYVVVGSYSTEANAMRAVSSIEGKNSDLKCHIFKLGSMYAVAIYGSSEKSECESFIRDYRKQFSQSWIHTPKRFR